MIKPTFWERLLAKIIDHQLFCAVVLLGFLAVTVVQPDLAEAVSNSLLLLTLLFLLFPLQLLYKVYLTSRFGGTLGKIVLGLKVVDENDKHLSLKLSTFRHTAGYLLSGVLCGIGYLWVFKKDRLAWHDLLTNTRVVRKNDHDKVFRGLLAVIILLTFNTVTTVTVVASLAANSKLQNEIQTLFSKLSTKEPPIKNQNSGLNTPTLSKSLLFRNGGLQITFDRMGSGKTEGTFWDVSPTYEYGAKWTQLNDNEIARNLYGDTNGSWFSYIQPNGIYYELQPGGYRTLKIVDADYIRSQIKNENATLRQVSCRESDYPMGTIATKAIACTTTITNPEDINQKDVSTTTNCYLGLPSNSYGTVTQYLAYEQKVKPMGDANTCDILTYMGVQGISESVLGEIKTAEVLVQDGSYYQPASNPPLFQLEVRPQGYHLFAQSFTQDLNKYLGQVVKVTYREVEGAVMGEQQLVAVTFIE